jgi:hypothetical protein
LSNIANGSLTNSTVSYGGVSLALGASDATPAFDLTDATNYPTSSLTGTITNAQLAGSIEVSKTLLAGGTGLTLSTNTLSVDAAQTQITSVGTLGSLTVTGDLTVDTSTLKVDSTNNRVGIGNASPDVSLDIGSFTDAIHVPSGTTGERPESPAAGYLRYNSTTGDFEGYTDAWGAIAGAGGTAPAIDTMTGDGSDTTLTLTSAPVNENATVVTIDGVVQHKDTYSVSSNTLTFSTAPPTGTAVECITWTNTAINSALLMQDADGDTQIQVEESSDEDKIRFDTAGTERMVIDSTGVGIGTTSPTEKLSVLGGHVSVGDTTGVSGTEFLLEGYREVSGGTKYGNTSIRTTYNTGSNASDMLFYTASGGTNTDERLRITSAGNVGIGTSSPSAPLHVDAAGMGDIYSGLIENTTTDTDHYNVVRFIQGASGSATGVIGTGGSATGNTAFRDSFVVGTQSASPLVFTTSDTERMRIESGGNLCLGSTSAAAKLRVNYTGESYGLRVGTTATSGVAVQFVYEPSDQVGTITNTTSATAYNTSSDYRLKEDDVPMTGATERVKALRPINFAWKIDGSRVDGFFAHEAQEVVPEAVHGTKDAMRDEEYEVTPAVLDDDGNVVTEAVMGTRSVPDMQGIDHSKLVPLLTAALQEAITKIEDLTTRLETLENA